MAKLSVDYCFKLLKSMNAEEKQKFLLNLEADPLLGEGAEEAASVRTKPLW